MRRRLFDAVVPAAETSRRFQDVRDTNAFAAARRMMDQVFEEYCDVDGSFIREFQTNGFSPRVFELAVWAYLQEVGLPIDRRKIGGPDFLIGGAHPLAIEVTTSNPTQGAERIPDLSAGLQGVLPGDLLESEREFVFQAAKALRRKLLWRNGQGLAYWEQPGLEGVPFVVALECFHHYGSLINSMKPLTEYLYGQRNTVNYDADGKLVLGLEPISTHEYRGKSIPSGLFASLDAAYLSGVLFSNAATINKFNRIGTERGLGHPEVAMIRVGTLPNLDPDAIDPLPFAYLVDECGPEDREPFSEGFNLIHNPWAKFPLPIGALPHVVEHELADGQVVTSADSLHAFQSQTVIDVGPDALNRARRRLEVIVGE